jgi:hypothetical protein
LVGGVGIALLDSREMRVTSFIDGTERLQR